MVSSLMKTVWLHSLNHQEKPAAIKKHHELDKPTLACLLSRRMFLLLLLLLLLLEYHESFY